MLFKLRLNRTRLVLLILCFTFVLGLNCIQVSADDSYNEASSLFERINVMPLYKKHFNGFGVKIALIDIGVDFKNPELAQTFIVTPNLPHNQALLEIPKRRQSRGTAVALIIAGKNKDGKVGVAPEAQIAVYAEDPMALMLQLKHAYDLGVQIVNISSNDFELNPLIESTEPWLNEMAIVVRGGDFYHERTNEERPSVFIEKQLEERYSIPISRNIIVTVGVDDKNELNPASKKCGAAKNFCVGIPSSGYSTKTAPIMSGALALLMEAYPRFNAATYVSAILDTSKDSNSPSDDTGRGLINVGAAMERLSVLQERLDKARGYLELKVKKEEPKDKPKPQSTAKLETFSESKVSRSNSFRKRAGDLSRIQQEKNSQIVRRFKDSQTLMKTKKQASLQKELFEKTLNAKAKKTSGENRRKTSSERSRKLRKKEADTVRAQLLALKQQARDQKKLALEETRRKIQKRKSAKSPFNKSSPK